MRRAYPILMALLAALFFGAATPASKSLLKDFGPFTLAGLLYLGAVVGVFPPAASEGGRAGAMEVGEEKPSSPSRRDRFGRVRGARSSSLRS